MAKSNRTEEQKSGAQSPVQYTPSPVLTPGAAAIALRCFETYREQLWAIGDLVEHALGRACNEGDDPPDDAPIQEWRLMQVMMDLLESKKPSFDLNVCMGQHLLPSSAAAEGASS
jgi:hypothetical protein